MTSIQYPHQSIGLAHDEFFELPLLLRELSVFFAVNPYAGHFQGLQIEDNHFTLCPVADEAAVKLRCDGDPVVLLQSSNVPDEGTTVGIDDLDFRAM